LGRRAAAVQKKTRQLGKPLRGVRVVKAELCRATADNVSSPGLGMLASRPLSSSHPVFEEYQTKGGVMGFRSRELLPSEHARCPPCDDCMSFSILIPVYEVMKTASLSAANVFPKRRKPL
jgi:hypothetical protein